VEAGDGIEQGRFAAPGGTDHNGDFAGRHVEGAVVDRENAGTLDAVHFDGVNDADPTCADGPSLRSGLQILHGRRFH
jgi:hypothetical protein